MKQEFYLLDWLRWWATLLDSRFRVPGTNVRFGLDPLLSLIPGLGDLASPAYTVALLVQGLQQRVPRIVLARMVLNALLDALIGVVPIAGTVADVFWRANVRNLALLERYARPGRPPERADYLFVFGIAALFGVAALVPVVLGMWIFVWLWQRFGLV
jgi:ABC-type antimicrobial peptide transport system permease subunit